MRESSSPRATRRPAVRFREHERRWPCYVHSGMYGMYLMQESIRQLRGEAYRQVSDVEVAFCQGVGGMFAAAGSIIWTNQPPF